MPVVQSGEYEIYFDVHGDDADPAILLVSGLGVQLIGWQQEFVDLLTSGGHRVIRMDNREVGLSTRTAGDPPNVMALMAAALTGGELPAVPYTLSDMAADAVAVVDAVGVDTVHVIGMSMGGMIAQTFAIEHSDRTASLTSIMSTTGNPAVGAAKPEAMTALLQPIPSDRETAIERTVAISKVIGGDHFDADRMAAQVAESYDRAFNPDASAFQISAIAASGDRTEALRQLDVPTLVIHGRQDPLITLSGGEATAEAIPDAELVILDDMAHDWPPQIWDRAVDAISKLTAAV